MFTPCGGVVSVGSFFPFFTFWWEQNKNKKYHTVGNVLLTIVFF
jgi:hypothetical protein